MSTHAGALTFFYSNCQISMASSSVIAILATRFELSFHSFALQNSSRAAALALVLLVLGFVVGYGFHASGNTPPTENETVASASKPALVPPIVKGLRASPDGSRLAFTGVYGAQTQASRFILDLKTKALSAQATPRGWQDYIVQWSADNRRILFDREKIPRAVEDTTPGLHEADVAAKALPSTSNASSSDAHERALTPRGTLPSGEKSVAGFWTPQGALVVKTRREPKTLYLVRDGRAVLVDRANVTYQQNRAVQENGKTVFYVVRDLPASPKESALFRVEGKSLRRLSEPLSDVEWVYVAEDARWMVVCRDAGDDANWLWTLYRVSPQRAIPAREEAVTKDVSGVFWSLDRKHILGASGKSLWMIDIPTLHSRRLGTREDWNADDATWLPQENAVIIATRGTLWKVDALSGAAREIWKFPSQYWS